MFSYRVLFLALLVALAAFPAGCGSSGNTTGSTSNAPASAPTKEEFIFQAEAICNQTDIAQQGALESYLEQHPKTKSSKAGERAFVLAAGLPPVRKEAEKLGRLRTPSGDEQQVRAIVEAMEGAVAKLEAKPELLLESGSASFNEAKSLATKYGLKACAEPL